MGVGLEVKLHTVFITHNRLHLTKLAIASYEETVNCDHEFVVVDNCSTDGTREWLEDFWALLLEDNRYPGFATNQGWWLAADDATHLQRADNDWAFLPGWCEEVERCFTENPKLGQLGLRTAEQEQHNTHNVGGNCVIRRELWDAGLRYRETPWPKIKTVGYTEDSFMSPEVIRMGWEWGRVEKPCITSLADEDPYDEYYLKSWKDRGLLEWAKAAHGITD